MTNESQIEEEEEVSDEEKNVITNQNRQPFQIMSSSTIKSDALFETNDSKPEEEENKEFKQQQQSNSPITVVSVPSSSKPKLNYIVSSESIQDSTDNYFAPSSASASEVPQIPATQIFKQTNIEQNKEPEPAKEQNETDTKGAVIPMNDDDDSFDPDNWD